MSYCRNLPYPGTLSPSPVLSPIFTCGPLLVYCLDRLAEPDEEFNTVATRLAPSFEGSFHYGHMDVRDTDGLEGIVESIASQHSRLDGLIAAAGVQHISPALDYPPH